MLIDLNSHAFDVQQLRFKRETSRPAHEPLFVVLCFDPFFRGCRRDFNGVVGPRRRQLTWCHAWSWFWRCGRIAWLRRCKSYPLRTRDRPTLAFPHWIGSWHSWLDLLPWGDTHTEDSPNFELNDGRSFLRLVLVDKAGCILFTQLKPCLLEILKTSWLLRALG